MDKYIGIDVHAASSTIAVIGESGRRLGSSVVKTNGEALVRCIRAVGGKLHVCLEEGVQSARLYELLEPHAERKERTHHRNFETARHELALGI
jgi:hypothetical protein